MTNYTHMNSINVQGSIESLTQGKLVGSFDTMPAATALNSGQIVLYTGPTGTYTKGKFYVSNGTSWVLSDASPSSVTIDSALSSTSTNPVQNKVIQAALNGKLGKTETAAKATADADGNTISATYLKQTDAANAYATKTELTSAVSSVYKFRGSVAAYGNLPTSGQTVGDVYNVEAAYGNIPAGTNWAWNGSTWDALAGTVDLSPYATKTELTNGLAGKQNTLTFDSTPTSGSSNPVTSGGVYSAINTKSYRGSFSGNGSTKEFTLTHNLGAIPMVQAFDSTGQYFLTDMVCTTTTVKFIFNTAPASGASYTVVATI